MTLIKIIRFILILEVLLIPLFFLPPVLSGQLPGLSLVFHKQVLIIILTVLALLLYLVRSARSGVLTWRRSALDYPLLGFLLVWTLVFAFSANHWNSLWEWASVLGLAISFWLINNVFAKKREKLLNYLLTSGFAVSLVFLTAILGSKLGWQWTGQWLANPLTSQARLVGFLAVLFILGLVKLKGGRFKKIFLVLELVVFLGLIFLVNFVVGWTALALGSLALITSFLSQKKQQERSLSKIGVGLTVLVCLVSLIFLSLDLPSLINLKLPAEVSLSRSLSWQIGWKTSLKRVFGFGPANFSLAFARFKPARFAKNALWNIRFQRARGQWLEMLAVGGWLLELAWFGLIVLALIIVFWQGFLLSAFLALLAVSWYSAFTPTLYLTLFVMLAVATPQGRKVKINLGEAEGQGSNQGNKISNFVSSAVPIAGILGLIFLTGLVGRIYLGSYWAGQGKWVQAIKYNSHQANYLIGQAREKMSQALRQARVASKEDANRIQILVSQAVSLSDKAVKASPEQAFIWQSRAALLESGRNLIKNADEWIEKAYKKAIDLEPNNPYLYQQLGICLARQEKAEQAFDKLNKAVELRPNLQRAQYQLGKFYYNKGDIEASVPYFQRAIRINPDYANALYSLGLGYEKLGNKETALPLFEKVLELNPDNQEIEKKVKKIKGLKQDNKKKKQDKEDQ